MSPPATISPIAQTSFTNSTAYDAHRPTYPQASIQHLLSQCRVAGKRGARIIDLAAGTGKFTEALAAREEGFEIVAVEPHADMRRVLSERGLKGVRVVDGTAEEVPVEDGWADAVFVAQAFHWFATPQTLQSLHRTLQPHGTLGLIWNIESYNAPPSSSSSLPTAWEKTLQAHTLSFDDSQPRFRHEQWRKVFEDQVSRSLLNVIVAADDPLFSMPLGANEEAWTVWLSREKVWERYRTLGQVAVLEGGELEKTRKVFDDAINGPDVEENEKGEVALHGTTYCYWTTKIPADGKKEVFAVARPEA